MELEPIGNRYAVANDTSNLQKAINNISHQYDYVILAVKKLKGIINDTKSQKEPTDLEVIHNEYLPRITKDNNEVTEDFRNSIKMSEAIDNLSESKLELIRLEEHPQENLEEINNIRRIINNNKVALENIINDKSIRLRDFIRKLIISGTGLLIDRPMTQGELRYISDKCKIIKKISTDGIVLTEQLIPNLLNEALKAINNHNLGFGLQGHIKNYIRKNKDNLDLSEIPEEYRDVINAPFTTVPYTEQNQPDFTVSNKKGGRRSRKSRKGRKSRKNRRNSKTK